MMIPESSNYEMLTLIELHRLEEAMNKSLLPYTVMPNLRMCQRQEVASDQLKTPIMTSSMEGVVLVFTIPVLGMSCKAYQLLLASCDRLLLTLPLVN